MISSRSTRISCRYTQGRLGTNPPGLPGTYSVRIAEASRERTIPRRRVLKACAIKFGRSAIDCTVRNLFDKREALDVPSPAGIPATTTFFAKRFLGTIKGVLRITRKLRATYKRDIGKSFRAMEHADYSSVGVERRLRCRFQLKFYSDRVAVYANVRVRAKRREGSGSSGGRRYLRTHRSTAETGRFSGPRPIISRCRLKTHSAARQRSPVTRDTTERFSTSYALERREASPQPRIRQTLWR